LKQQWSAKEVRRVQPLLSELQVQELAKDRLKWRKMSKDVKTRR
jgi:hypothetical protein